MGENQQGAEISNVPFALREGIYLGYAIFWLDMAILYGYTWLNWRSIGDPKESKDPKAQTNGSELKVPLQTLHSLTAPRRPRLCLGDRLKCPCAKPTSLRNSCEKMLLPGPLCI